MQASSKAVKENNKGQINLVIENSKSQSASTEIEDLHEGLLGN